MCKVVYGWGVGERATTELALAAWRQVKKTFHTIPQRAMIIHHHGAPVFTGYGWTAQLLLGDDGRISYALREAKDNPEMACPGIVRRGEVITGDTGKR